MFWSLVALIVAGVGAAGIGLILRTLSRNKLPKWIVPAFAGIGMLAFQIHSEYNWYSHTSAKLPDGSLVVATEAKPIIWRPWTYLYPMVTSFTVLDSQQIHYSDVEGDRIAQFVLYRFDHQSSQTVTARPHVLNCNNGELLQLDENGKPQLDTLSRLDEQDRLRSTVCSS